MMNDKTVSKYIDVITSDAKAATAEAKRQTEQYKAEQIEKYNERLDDEMRREYIRRTDRIREEIGRAFSKDETAVRSRIFDKRVKITEDVFALAAKKLIKFTNGDEYTGFLVNSALKIRQNLIGRDKAITVYMRPCDMDKSEKIAESLAFPCVFEKDDSIKIGGIRAKFGKIIIDDTLDARLSSQTGWFEENSGLDIQ